MKDLELATKQSLKELELNLEGKMAEFKVDLEYKMAELKVDLIKWIVGLLFVQASFIIAMIKLT